MTLFLHQATLGPFHGIVALCSSCDNRSAIIGTKATDADVDTILRKDGWTGIGDSPAWPICPTCSKLPEVPTPQPEDALSREDRIYFECVGHLPADF